MVVLHDIAVMEPNELAVAAKDAVSNLLYTAIFDTCTEIFSAGIGDEETVLQCGNAVMKKYVGEGVKVRKKPAPRVIKPKEDTKLRQKIYEQYVWIAHPNDEQYMYTTSVQLVTGYPVKEVSTNKVIGIINNETCTALTQDDARVAVSLGLQVNYDSVGKAF